MVFAFNYGGRVEIVDAVRSIADEVAWRTTSIRTDDRRGTPSPSHLYIPDMPDPDLVIRTEWRASDVQLPAVGGGLQRVRVHPVLWPDFDRVELARCIAEYQDQ